MLTTLDILIFSWIFTIIAMPVALHGIWPGAHVRRVLATGPVYTMFTWIFTPNCVGLHWFGAYRHSHIKRPGNSIPFHFFDSLVHGTCRLSILVYTREYK